MKTLRNFQKELERTIPGERMASALSLTKNQTEKLIQHGFEYFCELSTAEEWKVIIETTWGYAGTRYDVNSDVVYDTNVDESPKWWLGDCVIVQVPHREELPKFEVYADDEFSCLLGTFVPKTIIQTMEALAVLDAGIIPECFDFRKNEQSKTFA